MAVCPYCRQPPLVASYDTPEETVAELYSNPPPLMVQIKYTSNKSGIPKTCNLLKEMEIKKKRKRNGKEDRNGEGKKILTWYSIHRRSLQEQDNREDIGYIFIY